jgi:hypothetical protein
MYAGLTLEQAPPLAAPLRFFRTAPMFGVLAAALLLWQRGDVFSSRWTPASLALTHLLTLGFMAMVMIGALLQMLPVVVSSPVPRPLLLSRIVHAMLCAGTLALAGGLLWLSPPWLVSAQFLLASGFGLFLAASGYSAVRAPARTLQSMAIGLALIGLTVTVFFGVLLVSGLLGQRLPLRELAKLHVAWGLLGWTAILVIGIAFQVVPMLQMTKPYPLIMQRSAALGLFALLVSWSVADALLREERWAQASGEAAIAVVLIVFAVLTLVLQQRRKRRVADPSLSLWRLSMASLAASALLWIVSLIHPQLAEARSFPLAIGVLSILGFAISLMIGMLYKIVPFLVWFHLQSLGAGFRGVPTMKEIVPDRSVRWQAWAHNLAVLLTLAACVEPPLVLGAACALALSCGWLWWNIRAAWQTYRSKHAELLSAVRPKPSSAPASR